jgi:hypothetical protein
MSAPEQPTPGAMDAVRITVSSLGYTEASTGWMVQLERHMALTLDRFAAKRAAEAVAELRCAACDGHYPNPDCPHLRNARDMGERIPCVPAQAATPPPIDAGPTEDDWKRAAKICREVAELPDRTSPNENADFMLVTGDELQPMLADAFAEVRTAASSHAAVEGVLPGDTGQLIGDFCYEAYQQTGGTAAASQARRDMWQPIDTAPKDGRTVLLYFGEHDLAFPVIVSGFWDTVQGDWWKPQWRGATHWQPLPEPPCALATPQEVVSCFCS